jgi:hypothetical protein
VYQQVTPSFITKHVDKVKWYLVLSCQELPEEFIEQYANKIDWDIVSTYQKLSPEFVLKHIDKVRWTILLNPCFESYPDSVKLLFKRKFGM